VSQQSRPPLLTTRTAVVLLWGLVCGASAAVLTYLAGDNAAAAILAGLDHAVAQVFGLGVRGGHPIPLVFGGAVGCGQQQARVPVERGLGRRVQGRRDSGRPLQQAVPSWRPVVAQVLVEVGVQLRQERGEFAAGSSVGGDATNGLNQSGPAVTQRRAAARG
jgi:hypothetical protein